jgi:hypothetical protein
LGAFVFGLGVFAFGLGAFVFGLGAVTFALGTFVGRGLGVFFLGGTTAGLLGAG